MRRRCHEYKLNPHWDGVLKNDAAARADDPPASQDAACPVLFSSRTSDATGHIRLVIYPGSSGTSALSP
jgi:hypothetical protein